MSTRWSALSVLVALLGSCVESSGIVRWEDVEPARAAPPTAAPPARAARVEQPPPPPAPPPPAAPVSAPVAPIAVAATLVVNGTPVDDGALVEVPALELACLADARALSEPSRVAARVIEQGSKLGVALAPFSFVVMERDPARSLADPPPRFCRPLQVTAALVAPLLRHREPAARWLVRRVRGGLVADTAALLEESRARGLTASGRPRALVDDAGLLVALALPVGAGGG